jgi:hypothetical protein
MVEGLVLFGERGLLPNGFHLSTPIFNTYNGIVNFLSVACPNFPFRAFYSVEARKRREGMKARMFRRSLDGRIESMSAAKDFHTCVSIRIDNKTSSVNIARSSGNPRLDKTIRRNVYNIVKDRSFKAQFVSSENVNFEIDILIHSKQDRGS